MARIFVALQRTLQSLQLSSFSVKSSSALQPRMAHYAYGSDMPVAPAAAFDCKLKQELLPLN